MSKAWPVAGLMLGALITWFDARPGNDDTAISAGVILIVAAIFGFLDPRRPWLHALLLAGGIPLVGILQHGNYGALLAVVIALVGAYGGMGIRRVADVPQG